MADKEKEQKRAALRLFELSHLVELSKDPAVDKDEREMAKVVAEEKRKDAKLKKDKLKGKKDESEEETDSDPDELAPRKKARAKSAKEESEAESEDEGEESDVEDEESEEKGEEESEEEDEDAEEKKVVEKSKQPVKGGKRKHGKQGKHGNKTEYYRREYAVVMPDGKPGKVYEYIAKCHCPLEKRKMTSCWNARRHFVDCQVKAGSKCGFKESEMECHVGAAEVFETEKGKAPAKVETPKKKKPGKQVLVSEKVATVVKAIANLGSPKPLQKAFKTLPKSSGEDSTDEDVAVVLHKSVSKLGAKSNGNTSGAKSVTPKLSSPKPSTSKPSTPKPNTPQPNTPKPESPRSTRARPAAEVSKVPAKKIKQEPKEPEPGTSRGSPPTHAELESARSKKKWSYNKAMDGLEYAMDYIDEMERRKK